MELGLNDEDPTVEGPNLSVYKDSFERRYLEGVERLCHQESSAFLEHIIPVTEYMRKVEQRFQDEQRRALLLHLHESTMPQIAKMCEKILIEKHLETFHSEFKKLLNDQKYEDLGRMYRLVRRIPEGLGQLISLFKQHVQIQALSSSNNNCDQILNEPIHIQELSVTDQFGEYDTEAYFKRISVVYQKFSNLVFEHLNRDTNFAASLDEVSTNSLSLLRSSCNYSTIITPCSKPLVSSSGLRGFHRRTHPQPGIICDRKTW